MVTLGRTTAPGAFIMAHYSDHPSIREYTRAAIDSVLAQTDPSWRLFVVDDVSPRTEDVEALRGVAEDHPDRIVFLQNKRNVGQGPSRNRAIREASLRGCPFVLFLDCDDLAHPRRLEVTRRVFDTEPDVNFMYSPFTVIDENGALWSQNALTPSIVEILEQYEKEPLEGGDCWYRMATETGYVTLTSTVSVRTQTMLDYPFFEQIRGMEDVHCWMRIFSGNGEVRFEPSIPASYRIPASVGGSSERGRIGPDFYRLLVGVHRQSYVHAILAALRREALAPESAADVYIRALRRLRTTVQLEGEHGLAAELDEEIRLLGSAIDAAGRDRVRADQ